MRKILLTFTAMSLLSSSVIFAQSQVIKGKVVDSNKEGVPGALINVKGTNINTVTDEDGNFSIEVNDPKAVLIFSSMGTEKSVPVSAANGTIVLDEKSTVTEDVIVYGQKIDRRTYTGSISEIKAEDIAKRPVTNVVNALSGAAPGVMVTTGSGQPGSSPDIMLRGQGSLSASSAPLIVLDGAPYSGSLTSINPLDVESMVVLKDATAKAVYGSRAANGVILITTKRGRTEGKAKINFDASVGALSRMGREYKRLGVKDYYETAWRGFYNNMLELGYAPEDITSELFVEFLGGYNAYNVPNDQLIDKSGGAEINSKINANATQLYKDDWLQELSRVGVRQNYNISVANGNADNDYYISVGYTRDQGIVKNSDYNRITALIKANSKVTNWLRTGFKIQTSRDNQLFFLGSGTAYVNPFFSAREMGSIYPVFRYDASGNKMYNEDGTPVYDFGNNNDGNNPGGAQQLRPFGINTNGVAALYYNRPTTLSFTGTGMGFLEATIAKDLTARTNINIDLYNAEQTQYYNSVYGDAANVGGRSAKVNVNNLSWTFNQFVTYRPSTGIFDPKTGKHSFALTVGHEAYNLTQRSNSLRRTGFVSPTTYELSMAALGEGSSSELDKLSLESYFSQLEYNFDKKYYITGSFSRNASSRFAPSKRWGNFGSAGVGWMLSNESFMKDYNWIDMLKLRASWGITGNDAINNLYAYMSRYAVSHNNTNAGVRFANFASPDLVWEGQVDMSAGIDFGFKKRFNGSLDFYSRGSNDLLFVYPLAPSVGSTGYYYNVGATRNTGVELQLSADAVRTQNFVWNLRLNLANNKNQIISLRDGEDSLIGGGTITAKGHAINSFFMPEYAGVDATGASTWYKKDGSTTSDYRSLTTEDYKMFGSSFRPLEGSVTSYWRYKSLDLSVLVQFGLGGKFYDNTYAGLMSGGPDRVGNAIHEDMLNVWKQPGDENNPDVVPSFSYGSSGIYSAALSSRFLVSNSFMNIKNINLGYNFNQKALKRAGFTNLRVYAASDNIFQKAARIGIDPNTAFFGVSSYSYFPYRTFVVGVNVGL